MTEGHTMSKYLSLMRLHLFRDRFMNILDFPRFKVPISLRGVGTILLVIVLFTSYQNDSIAQGLGGIDFKSVRVDDLSDEDILGYMQQAEARGLGQSELELLAKQQGVSDSEISKLRRRIEKLRNEVPKQDTTSESVTARTLQSNTAVNEKRVQLSKAQKEIFGFDLFQKQSLTFAPNMSLPTPVDYQLGSGDELAVDLWGDVQQFFKLEVSTEGTVRPQNLSPIYVNGLTIEAATEKIIDRLSQTNNGLKPRDGSEPTIFYQVSLGNIRTINVNVVGNVSKPGLYSVPSLATVYTAIHAAGGPTEIGTFRDIRLVRDNKLVSTIDLYSFLTDGVRSGDIRLKNGDVVVIKPLGNQIELDGEVRRKGKFELKDGELFEDLLTYAGGFTSVAFKSTVTVKRNGLKEREILDIDSKEFNSFEPKDGDFVEVSAISDRFANRVIIDGAVLRDGEYQLTDGLTLKGLIEKADGLRGDAYLSRATIYRTNEDFSQSTIAIDLGLVLKGLTPDVQLLREDVIRITSIYDLREEYFVQITGEVQEEGVWPFFDQMTVKDLVILAKGLKESTTGAIVEISRRNKSSSSNTTAEIIRLSIDGKLSILGDVEEVFLQPFDQVYIRKSPGYTIQQQVTLEGEVVLPGTYTISRKDERISDLLKRAEGLTQYAYPQGAILIRKTEFSSAKSNDELSQEYMQQLRQKVLGDETKLKNISQVRLIERLDKIGSNVSYNSDDDTAGSNLKKKLIEDISEQDSLVRNIKIEEEEPVAIDLEKINLNPGSKFDLIVRQGDIISIPGVLQTVRVAGEVTSPLNVRYDSSYSFKDYIYRSGGFLASAKKNRSYIQYPNGERMGVRRFLFFKKYPKVQPGSTIFVSRKPERNGIGAQGWIGLGSGIATIGLVVVQAIRLTN